MLITESIDAEMHQMLKAQRAAHRANNECHHCGEKYADCRYPVSHGVPSIDSITLPAEANNIALKYKNGESTAAFTSYEREIWDRAAVMGYSNF